MDISLSQCQIHFPDFPAAIWSSKTPYSTVMRITQDRRNPSHTKRPLNAFMLFAKIQRDHMTAHVHCNHSEISKALGRLWQSLDRSHKEPFTSAAKVLVELHKREFPEYKYRPRKKLLTRDRSAAAMQRRAPEATQVLAPGSLPVGVMTTSSPAASITPLQHSLTTNFSSDLTATTSAGADVALPTSPLSIGSSSGYESDPVLELTTRFCFDDFYPQHCHQLPAAVDVKPQLLGPDYWYPLSAAHHHQNTPPDLQDIDLSPLDDFSQALSPFSLFPALDLTRDDLDDLKLIL